MHFLWQAGGPLQLQPVPSLGVFHVQLRPQSLQSRIWTAIAKLQPKTIRSAHMTRDSLEGNVNEIKDG